MVLPDQNLLLTLAVPARAEPPVMGGCSVTLRPVVDGGSNASAGRLPRVSALDSPLTASGAPVR